MKSILITGGSGKVGFQLVLHFLRKQYRVITTTTNKERFLKKRENELSDFDIKSLEIIQVDFNTSEAILKITEHLESKNIVLTDIIHNARSLNFLKFDETNQ
jgi:short-subunit dehydrogenase